jgi:hypothetical protein
MCSNITASPAYGVYISQLIRYAINGRNSANLELLIDKTSSIYLYVKALASWIFLSFTSYWRNSNSYEHKNKSARRGAQFVPISSASFLYLYLEFDDSGKLSTKIYDKRDDFNFKIINFPNMCSNITASPAYGAPTHMSIKINRLEEGHNSYPLVCRRPAETVSLQNRVLFYII